MEFNCNIFQFKNICNVFFIDDGIFCFVYLGFIYVVVFVGVVVGYMFGVQILFIYIDFDKVNFEEQVIFFYFNMIKFIQSLYCYKNIIRLLKYFVINESI